MVTGTATIADAGRSTVDYGQLVVRVAIVLDGARLPPPAMKLTLPDAVAWEHHAEQAWAGCRSPYHMLRLVLLFDVDAAVAVVNQLARLALWLAPPGRPRALRAVEKAEALACGRGRRQDVVRDVDALHKVVFDIFNDLSGSERSALLAIRSYAVVVLRGKDDPYERDIAAASAVNDLCVACARFAIDAHCAGSFPVWDDVVAGFAAQIADVIRACAPCPRVRW